jgi:murein DD-endopeptidase MepM/ murein hydrolase activator NlpD
MDLRHKAALITASFLVVLGACSLWSTVPGPRPAEGGRDLVVPIAGVSTGDLVDSWGAARDGGRRHEGVDIMAEQGTQVRAAASGKILKLHTSDRGGLTVYQSDASGRFILCYSHLSAYAPELEEGMAVEQGQVIAAVGQTGNATRPHLHFEVLRAKEAGQWWGGEALNPYRALLAGRVDDEPARASATGGQR